MYEAAFRHFREEGMFYAKGNYRAGPRPTLRPAGRMRGAGFDIRCEDVTYYKKL